jgi:hypothetical protein
MKNPKPNAHSTRNPQTQPIGKNHETATFRFLVVREFKRTRRVIGDRDQLWEGGSAWDRRNGTY